MTTSTVLDLALALWPGARDTGSVERPADLDALLDAHGQPGAPGFERGVRGTFACFPPGADTAFMLPTGESPRTDEEARFIAHVLVTRTLLAAGLFVDERVTQALCDTYAMTWTAEGGRHGQTALALASTLWLIALDPLSASDRPLPIDWSAAYYDDPERWDPTYRLFSHYDIRERGVDWAAYVSLDPARHEGCSTWTVIEPLLRMEPDGRARLALAQLGEHADSGQGRVPAAAMLERGRIAAMLQAHLRATGRGGRSGRAP